MEWNNLTGNSLPSPETESFHIQLENNEKNTQDIGKVWNIPIYATKVYSGKVFVFWDTHASVKFL